MKMNKQGRKQMSVSIWLVVLLAFFSTCAWAARGGGGGGGGGTTPTQNYDTSFAVEYSYSCLEGGCHENNQTLVNQYSDSVMTHVMVKCNACHGTHGADTVGTAKPNLTGYFPGIGATGYEVGRDRCKACHNNQHNGGRASKNDCKSCHIPHVFAK